MLPELIDYAKENWQEWLGDPRPKTVKHIYVRGGPAHSSRALIALFSDRAQLPNVIIKVAFSPREVEYVKQEFLNLVGLMPVLPADLKSTVPQAFGSLLLDDTYAMFMSAVPGHRLPVPFLPTQSSFFTKHVFGSFLRRAFDWSLSLAQSPTDNTQRHTDSLTPIVQRFGRRYVDDSNGHLQSFSEHLSALTTRWLPCWQHRATDITNALSWRGHVRFVDWEHAAPDSEPWFDIGYAVLGALHLADRQSTVPSRKRILTDTLDVQGWIGSTLRSEMSRVWCYSLPISIGVVLVAMDTAVRRARKHRPIAADLAMGLISDDEMRSRISWLAPPR